MKAIEVSRDAITQRPGAGGALTEHTQTLGQKYYELSNHLGNVLTTISDRKVPVFEQPTLIEYFAAEIMHVQDYYPFGMPMPGRTYEPGDYRYGFNGKEQDPEIYGTGNIYDYGFRIYNPRIARFLSVDPLSPEYPWYTPYQFAGNTPIWAIDLDGLEPVYTSDNIILYRLQPGQGPTQIAEDMANRYGDNVDWYDIVLMNEQNFQHMTPEERSDKEHPKYYSNPAPPGETMFILGTYEFEEGNKVTVIPADKETVDYISKRLESYSGDKLTNNSRKSTTFENWQYENSNQQVLRNLFISLFGHGSLAGPSGNGLNNTLSGLPHSNVSSEYQYGESNSTSPIVVQETTYVPVIDTLRWETKRFKDTVNGKPKIRIWQTPVTFERIDTIITDSNEKGKE